MEVTYKDSRVVPQPELLSRVFAWMAAAIGLSGVTAYIVAQQMPVLPPFFAIALFVAQLLIVLALSWRIEALSYRTAQILFITYSMVTGATLSVIFAVYQLSSIANVFFISAGMFGVMALYGMVTKTDLSRYRNLLSMALLGIVLALMVNMFLGSSQFDVVVSVISVFLFCALTAFDIQNIKQLTAGMVANNESWDKIALIGALKLYLDFINIFLSLLRLFGKRR